MHCLHVAHGQECAGDTRLDNIGFLDAQGYWSLKASLTAPVSHQKQPDRNATNANEIEQNHSKINEAYRYPAAHNGLVAGSSPAGPTSVSMA